MRLGSFISGVFGITGFGISMLAGVGAGNTIESILVRGLVTASICYAVGYVVGMISQQVALEHADRISKMVAQQDKETEQKRLEDQAALDAEKNAAENAAAASPTPSSG